MKIIRSFTYMLLALAGTTSISYAQERTAGGAMETQMTWSALTSLVSAASVKADGVNARVDQVVKCNRKYKLYAPGGGADSDGCIENNEMNLLKSRMDSAEKNITDTNTALAALDGKVTQNINRIDASLGDIKNNMNALNTRVTGVESQVAGLNNRVNTLNAEINKVATRVETVAGYLDSRITNEANAINSRVGNLEGRVTNEVNAVNNRVTNLDGRVSNEVAGLNAQIKALNGQISELKGQVADLYNRSNEMYARTDSLRNDVNAIRNCGNSGKVTNSNNQCVTAAPTGTCNQNEIPGNIRNESYATNYNIQFWVDGAGKILGQRYNYTNGSVTDPTDGFIPPAQVGYRRGDMAVKTSALFQVGESISFYKNKSGIPEGTARGFTIQCTSSGWQSSPDM